MSDTTSTETPNEEPQGTEEENGEKQPTVEELAAKIEELTAHSRKWEGRAKENKAAADELAALKRQSMTDDEKAAEASRETEQRVQDAEKRAVAAEAELARYKVATEFGLDSEDVEALAAVTDEAALRVLAERLKGRSPAPPQPNPAQGNRQSVKGASTPEDAFAAALESIL